MNASIDFLKRATSLGMQSKSLPAWLDEIESLRQQLEKERMRNVACDVVAMADTPTSAVEARKMLPDYRSAALESVIRRVDECIELRQQLAAALAACKVKDSILERLIAGDKPYMSEYQQALAVQPDDSALKAWLG